MKPWMRAPPADAAVPPGDLVHHIVAPMPKVLVKQDRPEVREETEL
jgi:hypothetical protein